jgi:hypothetical protein
MPIALDPGIVQVPPLVAPAVPPGQRVTPVEPAKRVVPKKQSGRADLENEEKRRRSEDRGGLFDLEA